MNFSVRYRLIQIKITCFKRNSFDHPRGRGSRNRYDSWYRWRNHEDRGGKGEGREADGRQMSRAAGPCDSFNQSLGCVLPRSRTNYVQSCYEFKWKPALPSLLRIFFFFLRFSLFSFLSSLLFFFPFFLSNIYIYIGTLRCSKEAAFERLPFLKERYYPKEMARGF